MERELYYSDEKHRTETAEAIQKALTAQQRLLDTWNSLKLPPLKSLFELIHTPQRVYSRAVNGAAEDSYQQMLDVPMPNELYLQAKDARKCIQAGRPELWSIKDGKTVVLDQVQADALIHSQDIWVENEAQREFVDMAVAFVEGTKYFVTKLPSMLSMQSGFNIPFVVTGGGFLFIKDVELEYVSLKEMIKSLK